VKGSRCAYDMYILPCYNTYYHIERFKMCLWHILPCYIIYTTTVKGSRCVYNRYYHAIIHTAAYSASSVEVRVLGHFLISGPPSEEFPDLRPKIFGTSGRTISGYPTLVGPSTFPDQRP
jgi:hypothetical protein